MNHLPLSFRSFLLIILMSYSFFLNGQNLIVNPSFENEQGPSCTGWYDGCGNPFTIQCDSLERCGTVIVSRAQPDSILGKFALEVYGSFPNPGAAITYVPVEPGIYVYQLRFMMYTEHFLGEVYWGPMKNQSFVDTSFFQDWGQPWTQYTLTDTFNTYDADAIGVRLTAGLGDFCICDVAYDLIELTVIDTLLTSVTDQAEQTSIIKYPNPFSDQIIFEFPDERNIEIMIFDIYGRIINRNIDYGSQFRIDMSNIQSGFYFYSIFSDAVMLQSGKLTKLD